MEVMLEDYPCLRPVEATPDAQGRRMVITDPSRLAAGVLVVGPAEFHLLTLLDGSRTRMEIQREYARTTGNLLLGHELDGMLAQLAQGGFLDGMAFEDYYEGLVEGYRRAPYRPLRDRDGFGVPAAELPAYLDEILLEGASAPIPRADAQLTGIVVPHLDYERGRTCYGAGYDAMMAAARPQRVVILGTNHFGRSRSVVATRQDFETHWGVVETDRDFLNRLEADLGGNLTPYELDHLHEHSIELHAIWLRHLLGPEVKIVPALCPDPTGKRGTRPGDPDGVDLRDFALALGRLIREDPVPTLVIASADLSHVGSYFGDEIDYNEELLDAVCEVDEVSLQLIDANDAEAYREHMARTQNPTKVCSVGCLYALMTALGPEARAHRLGYHRASTPEMENLVTCAAYAFYG